MIIIFYGRKLLHYLITETPRLNCAKNLSDIQGFCSQICHIIEVTTHSLQPHKYFMKKTKLIKKNTPSPFYFMKKKNKKEKAHLYCRKRRDKCVKLKSISHLQGIFVIWIGKEIEDSRNKSFLFLQWSKKRSIVFLDFVFSSVKGLI